MKDFAMREYNIPAHVDIEADIQDKGTGQITFTLRINGGNIVDMSVVEYVSVKDKYGCLEEKVINTQKKQK
ncbi:hypothetical protein GW915_00325 [bacterium]|nr:hypothetical protein [bacterium]